MKREALAKKFFVLGIDGMDPRLTRKYVDEGILPNTKKLLEKGSAREDLVLLGGMPTVTPPMWTTLSTGAYPMTHGITCFWRQSKNGLEKLCYNLSSTKCTAESLWNVTVEAGKKTLVWHWPGSSWPPTSDSPLLHVVDGTSPAMVNSSTAGVDGEFLLGANEKTDTLLYRAKASTDGKVPCVIENLVPEKDYTDLTAMAFDRENDSVNLILDPMDGENQMTDAPFDAVLSPIKPAAGWAAAPADAKEFYILFSHGLIRRPCLILTNEQGIYDRIAIYKNKKETEPIVVMHDNEYKEYVFDEAVLDDDKYVKCTRHMRVLELQPDGSAVRMWISMALDLENDSVWHPRHLYKSVVENVGYPIPVSMLGGADRQLIIDCMGAIWESATRWQSDAINHLIREEQYEAVFSHFHILDNVGHMIVKYLKTGHKDLTAEDYREIFKQMYILTDDYIGRFMHLLDEEWVVCLVSDHAQVCPSYHPPMAGETGGVNVRFMEELGFTNIKHDADGNDLYEIDWENTRAIAPRANHIYINLKGRDEHGIVDPADKYQLEEEIMTALYGYRHKESGMRMIALAVRNKDAAIFGMGGPECGDIIYFLAEGYNLDHADSISTTYGEGETSVSPIFIIAGPGIKEGYYTDRVIRQVDVAPTLAYLAGVRMPAQCEGAPVYQIFTEEF